MIKPYYGQVIRTDSSGQYRDASDHNALFAKFSLDAATRAKVMTFNLHRATADDPGHEWVKRQPKCVRVIADWRPSVACLQELDTSMHDEFMGKLAEATGSSWRSLRNPNVAVAWMSDRWKLLASRTLNMDNADEPDRRLAMVLLQATWSSSQPAVWFGSAHLSHLLPRWRRRQARQIANRLGVLHRLSSETHLSSKWFGDVRHLSILGIDANDWAMWPTTSVRSVFHEAGLRELRPRLSEEQMIGDSRRTHHQYEENSPNDGRQIDLLASPIPHLPD